MTALTEAQRSALNGDIPTDAVHQKPGRGSASYVKGWWVIDQANQILGPDGWSMQTLSTQLLQAPEQITTRSGKKAWAVYFSAHVRVTVAGVTRDGCAVGSGTDGELSVALHNAIGEAETDALKRALKSFGRRLGLALYDSEQRYVSDALAPEQVHYGKARGRHLADAKSEWLTSYYDRLPDDCDPAHRSAVEYCIKSRIEREV